MILFVDIDPGSTLAQVMAWCLMAPNHYQKQFRLPSKVLCGMHLQVISQEVLTNLIPNTIRLLIYVALYIRGLTISIESLHFFDLMLIDEHPSFQSLSSIWKDFNYPCTLNPLRAKFFRRNINIYLHFVSFLHIDTTQVVEIPLQIRQEPTYAT